MNPPIKNTALDLKKVVLISILLFGVALRFYGLSIADIAGDDATYSFRSIGYLDYMASENYQPTPVSWFVQKQWWQPLSFHDHPPFVFTVQHLFFKLFSVSPFVARLPFALAGIVSIYLVYLVGRRLFGEAAGIIAAAVLAVSNYAVAYSRLGYLEGFVILFTLASILFFLKAQDKPSHFVSFFTALALGLLSKYTFVFAFPLFLVAFFVFRNKFVFGRHFYLGLTVFLFLISPVVIYNLKTYEARGHPDVAFSAMLGQKVEEFKLIGQREITSVGRSNPLSLFSASSSTGLFWLLLASVSVCLYQLFKKDTRHVFTLFQLGLVCAMIYVGGLGIYYGSVMMPAVALTIAGGGSLFLSRTFVAAKSTIAILLVVLLWEMIVSVQTQVMPVPISIRSALIASNRPSFEGYAGLERYVSRFYTEHPERSFVVWYKTPQIVKMQIEELQRVIAKSESEPPQQKNLLVYDDRMNWFAKVWIFERRALYNVDTIFPLSKFSRAFENVDSRELEKYGFESVYAIVALKPIGTSTAEVAIQNIQKLPITEVINGQGGEARFNVYNFPFKDSMRILFPSVVTAGASIFPQ